MSNQLTELGVTTVFLSANCVFMIVIVFLHASLDFGSIEDLIKKKIPSFTYDTDGNPMKRDPDRDRDFQEEIAEENLNKKY